MKRVLFFTGTRADWGLLLPLVNRFKADKSYEVSILATGSHFGNEGTLNEIIHDGFNIDYPVDLNLQQNPAAAAMGLGLEKFDQVLQKNQPDLAFILGDRYEALAFAIACQFNKIPVAHLHGGEITEGAIDDAFRHSITKLSFFHFATSEGYAKRIARLGEDPGRIFNVGALGVENARQTKLKSKELLEAELNIKLREKFVLVTFHPATLELNDPALEIQTLLAALLETLKRHSGLQLIFTMPNVDPGSGQVKAALFDFVKMNPWTSCVFDSLGRVNYLSLLALSEAVVGNSSSGIIEAPVFKVPTLNIGSRQTGREKAESIVDVQMDLNAIVEKLSWMLEQKGQGHFKNTKSLFGEGNASAEIKTILDSISLSRDLRKRFYEKST